MIAAPKRSYVVWFSQRVGSTLLTQALEDTGLAGRPREWFNAASAADVLPKLGLSSASELRDFLWREPTPAAVVSSSRSCSDALRHLLRRGWVPGRPRARRERAPRPSSPNLHAVPVVPMSMGRRPHPSGLGVLAQQFTTDEVTDNEQHAHHADERRSASPCPLPLFPNPLLALCLRPLSALFAVVRIRRFHRVPALACGADVTTLGENVP